MSETITPEKEVGSATRRPSEAGIKEIRRVTIAGTFVNFLLASGKIGTGLLASSSALVSDGINQLSDLVTDGFVLAGTHIASQPPDDKHPYGHGKYENIASLLIAALVITVGWSIIDDAAFHSSETKKEVNSIVVIIVSLFSIASKEYLFRIFIRSGRKWNSSALLAKAWDSRSDVIASSIVLLSGALGALGYSGYDRIAAMIVGAMIVYVGGSLIADNIKLLLEASAGKDTEEAIRAIVSDVDGVKGCHKLRSRFVGRWLFIDIHVEVDPDMSVRDGHRIATEIEDAVNAGLSASTNVLVHIEPYDTNRVPDGLKPETPQTTDITAKT